MKITMLKNKWAGQHLAMGQDYDLHDDVAKQLIRMRAAKALEGSTPQEEAPGEKTVPDATPEPKTNQHAKASKESKGAK